MSSLRIMSDSFLSAVFVWGWEAMGMFEAFERCLRVCASCAFALDLEFVAAIRRAQFACDSSQFVVVHASIIPHHRRVVKE
jgi:hypothetical protein